MKEYKTSKEDYLSSKPAGRLGKLRWWYLVLIALGLLALAYIWFTEGSKTIESLSAVTDLMVPVTSAYAQPTDDVNDDEFTPKVLIMAGIFVVLGLVYIVGIFKLFFSRNNDQVDTASDLVKTLTGFFVGAATGFLG